MPTQVLRFDGPEQLKDILKLLIDEMSARIVNIRVARNRVSVELDKEVELQGYGEENLWDHLCTSYVTTYDYMGHFSFGIVKDIFRTLKAEGLVPVYILIHPQATIKRTVEWRDMAISTMVGATFLGMHVVEDESIDEDGFIIAAGHSPTAQVHNIVMGVKGQVQ